MSTFNLKNTFKAALLTLGMTSFSFAGDIPVNFIILQESNGQGNEVWTKNNSYVDSMLKNINETLYKKSSVKLKLGSKRITRDSRLYNSPMSNGSSALIDKYKKSGVNGSILVVVARETKVDVNGRAERQGVDYSPVFIMRTVWNHADPKNRDYVGGIRSNQSSAKLFVHEMAHMMDLRHSDRPKSGTHTENYTTTSYGISIYKNYLNKLGSYNKSGSKGSGNGSGGSGGGNGGGGRNVVHH